MLGIGQYWERIENRWVENVETGCWEWTGPLNQDGYGQINPGHTSLKVHRISHAHHKDEPGTLCVCHTCDNRRCINPGHLWLGTKGDNNRDRDAKGRHARLRGEQHNMAILTESKVREIRAALSEGLLCRTLSAEYGVSADAIVKIKSGKNWGWLV